MKYQNKEGIALNLTQKNNSFTDLVKEVISKSINMLEDFVDPTIDNPTNNVYDIIEFLKENFDVKDEDER